ncbi:uncharacterized protein LOC135050363 isoform X1 [Pseudophryne corroboree]|uniref:uncharacterized protein LOC135050363 isoform X1 n=1 Tax=Pseudophryne corroboree TaxID=495146 RepID=UPI0030816DF5
MAAASAQRTSLFLLLLVDLFPVSPVRAVSHFAGGTVTLHCLEGSNRTLHRDDITQINWRKENYLHNLIYAFTKTLNIIASNFTDGRISFLSPEQPLTLRITDAQPSDSGNYTCDITALGGRFQNSWMLHVSDRLVIDTEAGEAEMGEPSGQPDIIYIDEEGEPQWISIIGIEEEGEQEEKKPSPQLGQPSAFAVAVRSTIAVLFFIICGAMLGFAYKCKQ